MTLAWAFPVYCEVHPHPRPFSLHHSFLVREKGESLFIVSSHWDCQLRSANSIISLLSPIFGRGSEGEGLDHLSDGLTNISNILFVEGSYTDTPAVNDVDSVLRT